MTLEALIAQASLYQCRGSCFGGLNGIYASV